MEVVADSHTLFWWSDPALHGRLSRKAQRALEGAERILVPTIVLLELLSLFERHKQAEKFDALLSRLTSPHYHIVPLSLAVVRRCQKLPTSLELHDRVIAATAQELGAYLITKDAEIKKVFRDTVW